MTCNPFREFLTMLIRDQMKVYQPELQRRCENWAHEVGNAVVNRLTKDGRDEDVLIVAMSTVVRLRNVLCGIGRSIDLAISDETSNVRALLSSLLWEIEREVGPCEKGGGE